LSCSSSSFSSSIRSPSLAMRRRSTYTSAYVSIRQHTPAYVRHPLAKLQDAQALHLCGDVCGGARPLQLLQRLQLLQHLCGVVCSGVRPLDIW
jgi:hypothetical protein